MFEQGGAVFEQGGGGGFGGGRGKKRGIQNGQGRKVWMIRGRDLVFGGVLLFTL